MATSFSANGKLIPATRSSTIPTSLSCSRKLVLSSSLRFPRGISTPSSPRVLYLKCSADLRSGDTEPSPKDSLLKPLAVLSLSSAAAAASVFLLRGGGGGGRGGGSFGGSGGGGDGNNDGGFWRSRFSPAQALADDEEQSPEWDPHGLPMNITVQLNNLNGFKKYKISEITFFDRRSQTTTGTEDIVTKVATIQPGGIYTKAQLKKELETLDMSEMFENVDMEGKTKPDGTLGVTISFTEDTWRHSYDSFRCIKFGLEGPCLMPSSVNRGVMKMLREQETVGARLFLRIRDHVNKWYFDQGYDCANLLYFRDLESKEMVCEVAEGDITQLLIQFYDELGNVVEDRKLASLVRSKLPKQLGQGYVYNNKAGKQALKSIDSLRLFSSIEVKPRLDEKNEGGIVVEINLQ